jgi:PEP-CTERM motif
VRFRSYCLSIALLFAHSSGRSQGNLVFDQQSSTDETAWPYGAGVNIQQADPYGQSFVPSLSALNLIRLNLNDLNPTNGLGVTLFLSLRTNSMSGSVLANTASVVLTNGFTGTADFSFPSNVSLTPGATYLFQIVIQGGDLWNAAAGEYNYPNGTAFYQGLPLSGSDLWFREGIVPEPSSTVLVLFGAGLFSLHCRRFRA